MSFLEIVHRDREDLARVLKKHKGIRRTVEELYPDSAHFIYELLQNAEDAGATEARFILEKELLNFQHNGRPFNEADIWAITDIGEGTKTDSDDKIGRFGVGFKAVFAYSDSPHIWSPTFSFRIADLVLPSAIPEDTEIGTETRFQFPFNNPKKAPTKAYEEIESGIEGLTNATLLFLSSLRTIRWKIGERIVGSILRVEHPQNHIEVVRQAANKPSERHHFLRFSVPVEEVPKQNIAVAFNLELHLNVTSFNPKHTLAKQFKISPAKPGQVSVFFPAEKETSGLRFHLHAPFVPELSRASIKETDANMPLFEQLARLAAASLHPIRDLGLLTGDLLGVLPNPQDVIPPRYAPIRKAIVEAMNNEPLTPTNQKSYAPAKHLLQAKASLKELLLHADLEALVKFDGEPFRWAIGASQKNSDQDKFLVGLAVTDWDLDSFISLLREKATVRFRHQTEPAGYTVGCDNTFMRWLAAKPIEWHQQMYALLYRELGPLNMIDQLVTTQIIRLSDETYSVGSKCYFPTNGVLQDDILPRVALGAYSSGKNKIQQQDARKLLEEIGVVEVGEAEQVQAILKQRYTAKALEPDFDDLVRFVSLIEKEPARAEMFRDYCVFERADSKWGKPSQVFLDSPYLDTGLSAYYRGLVGQSVPAALSDSYLTTPVSVERLVKFAEAVGVTVSLPIKGTDCSKNLAVYTLRAPGGGWSRTYGVDEDYVIDNLADLLKQPNEPLSKLIWKTLCSNKNSNVLKARFRHNSNCGYRTADSQLVYILKNAHWIPQKTVGFLKPSEAYRILLPKGFPFDEGYEWLKAIRFGADVEQRSEANQKRQAIAKDLGFADDEVLADAQWFANLSMEERKRFKDQMEERRELEFPENTPRNPELRANRVEQQAIDAPDRKTEERTRSVSIGREEVKQEAEQYLREQYTDADGDMFCQICKKPLPFRLENDQYFVENVEFMPSLRLRYHQNYLALCPNHSAMYRHANSSLGQMQEIFVGFEGNELDIVLARKEHSIRFTQTHILDLRKIIETDPSSVNPFDHEEEDSSV